MSSFSISFVFFVLFLIFAQILANFTNETNPFLKKGSSLAFYASQNVNSSNKYCQTCCIELQAKTIGKKCGSHTLCKYENQKIGPACKGFIAVQFTMAEKRLIVDAHNTIRNKVAAGLVTEGDPGPQPQASNMRAVEWDEELAAIADRWASQCIFGNDICRDLGKFPVGQNIARGTIATDGELSLLQKWFQEVRHFNWTIVEGFVLPKNGRKRYTRYSQLVWADTYLIGCARVIFQTNDASKIRYTEHFVCNYGPTGNIPNQKMYKIGPPCSECVEGTACTSSDYEALCTADSSEVFDDYLGEITNSFDLMFKKFEICLIVLLGIQINILLVYFVWYSLIYCVFIYFL